MKRKFLVIFIFCCVLQTIYSYALILSKVIRTDKKEISFFNDNIYFYRILNKITEESYDIQFYFYNQENRIVFVPLQFEGYYSVGLSQDTRKRNILGLSKEWKMNGGRKFPVFNYFLINESDFTYTPIDSKQVKLPSYRPELPEYLRDLYYDRDYVYAEAGDYCLIVRDEQNHGYNVNELWPEKHAYHDMDLCVIDKKGNVVGILPFVMDDQSAQHKGAVQASPSGKYIKIDNNVGWLSNPLLKKYPEFRKSGYYLIYELTEDKNNYDKTEVLDFTKIPDLSDGETITIEPIFKDYSDLNIELKSISD